MFMYLHINMYSGSHAPDQGSKASMSRSRFCREPNVPGKDVP